MDGLNQLKSLKIGINSFTQVKETEWDDDWEEAYDKASNQSKSFHILNCKSLESIEIGQCSFADFGGEFELKNLPSLQSIVKVIFLNNVFSIMINWWRKGLLWFWRLTWSSFSKSSHVYLFEILLGVFSRNQYLLLCGWFSFIYWYFPFLYTEIFRKCFFYGSACFLFLYIFHSLFHSVSICFNHFSCS